MIASDSDFWLSGSIRHNDGILEGEHPVYGGFRRARPPLQFSVTRSDRTPAPALYGEHTDEILAELGLEPADRDALRKKGVIPAPRS